VFSTEHLGELLDVKTVSTYFALARVTREPLEIV
jgi:hypothetical protein